MKRSRRLHVYLSDEEMNALYDICQERLTMSDAVRLLIMSAAKGCFSIPSDKKDEFDILYQEYTDGYMEER